MDEKTWTSIIILDIKENKIPSTTTPISSFNYGVNAIGQRTGVTTTGSALPSQPADWTWGYDALGQVITADSPNNTFDRAYEYDQIGNRKKSADGALVTTPESVGASGYLIDYQPNPLNQYDAIGSFSPTYDADGNQKHAQILPLGSSNLVSCVYHWDAENRLIAVKDTNNVDIVSYVYDSQSRRVARTQGSNVTLYLYDGWNCLAEYSASDLQTFDLKTAYTWGLDLSGSLQGAGGVGGLVAVTKHQAPPTASGQASTTHAYPTYDGNGNLSEYLDATGSIAAHYEYDPFGRTIVATGSQASEFAYRFSTKPVDPVTGLYYYGYRWYDPDTGRWINRDPIEERGGVNLYGIVGNSSVDWVDCLGLATVLAPSLDHSGNWHRAAGSTNGLQKTGGEFMPPPSFLIQPSNSVIPARPGSGGIDPETGTYSPPARSLPGRATLAVGGTEHGLVLYDLFLRSRQGKQSGEQLENVKSICDAAWNNLKQNHSRYFREGCPACCVYGFEISKPEPVGLDLGRVYWVQKRRGYTFLGFEPGKCWPDVIPKRPLKEFWRRADSPWSYREGGYDYGTN